MPSPRSTASCSCLCRKMTSSSSTLLLPRCVKTFGRTSAQQRPRWFQRMMIPEGSPATAPSCPDIGCQSQAGSNVDTSMCLSTLNHHFLPHHGSRYDGTRQPSGGRYPEVFGVHHSKESSIGAARMSLGILAGMCADQGSLGRDSPM